MTGDGWEALTALQREQLIRHGWVTNQASTRPHRQQRGCSSRTSAGEDDVFGADGAVVTMVAPSRMLRISRRGCGGWRTVHFKSKDGS